MLLWNCLLTRTLWTRTENGRFSRLQSFTQCSENPQRLLASFGFCMHFQAQKSIWKLLRPIKYLKAHTEHAHKNFWCTKWAYVKNIQQLLFCQKISRIYLKFTFLYFFRILYYSSYYCSFMRVLLCISLWGSLIFVYFSTKYLNIDLGGF